MKINAFFTILLTVSALQCLDAKEQVSPEKMVLTINENGEPVVGMQESNESMAIEPLVLTPQQLQTLQTLVAAQNADSDSDSDSSDSDSDYDVVIEAIETDDGTVYDVTYNN